MPIRVNRNLVTQVNSDSGSLTTLTTVVHRFSEPGQYHGVLIHGGGTVGRFTVSVASKGPKEDQPNRVTKAEVDLSQLHAQRGSETAETLFELEPDGYAVFRVPTGASGGYAVEVYKAGEHGRGAKVFDSRELTAQDVLSIIVLRPGTYSIIDAVAGGRKVVAELTVAYPEKPLIQYEPIRITCGKDGMTPKKIAAHPTQGLVFNFETASRIRLELVAADDRQRKPSPVAGIKAAKGGRRKIGRRLEMTPHRVVSA